MERIPALLFAGVILAAGCGSGAEEETRTGARPDGLGAAPATSDQETLYRGTGTVLEQGAGPQLCFSTLDSYPPQCGGGVELQGWDWSEATGYESANGTRWGSYEIVGHWDGESLAVVRFGPPGGEGAGVPAVDVAPFAVEGGVARTDLERILDEVSAQVETTWANLDLVGGRVEVGVIVVDPDVQAALDRQYGDGAVVLYGHLEPVE